PRRATRQEAEPAPARLRSRLAAENPPLALVVGLGGADPGTHGLTTAARNQRTGELADGAADVRFRARDPGGNPSVDRVADHARVVGDLGADALSEVLLDRVLVEVGMRVAAVHHQEHGARVDRE